MRSRIIVACLSACVLPTAALAADAGAHLTSTSGGVVIEHGGELLPATRGVAIAPQDTIITDRTGTAGVWTLDDTYFTLIPDTRLRIMEYAAPGGGAGIARYELAQGGVRTITGTIAKTDPDSFSMTTPMADIKALGTDYSTVICGSACVAVLSTGGVDAASGMYAKIDDGSIVVGNAAGNITGAKGQVIFVANAETPPVFVTNEILISALFASQFNINPNGDSAVDVYIEPPRIEPQTPASPS